MRFLQGQPRREAYFTDIRSCSRHLEILNTGGRRQDLLPRISVQSSCDQGLLSSVLSPKYNVILPFTHTWRTHRTSLCLSLLSVFAPPCSQSEMSVSDSSRYSTTGGKRPRNRSALRVAVRIRPIIDREEGSRTVTCRGSESGLVVVNPKKFKASAELVS